MDVNLKTQIFWFLCVEKEILILNVRIFFALHICSIYIYFDAFFLLQGGICIFFSLPPVLRIV